MEQEDFISLLSIVLQPLQFIPELVLLLPENANRLSQTLSVFFVVFFPAQFRTIVK